MGIYFKFTAVGQLHNVHPHSQTHTVFSLLTSLGALISVIWRSIRVLLNNWRTKIGGTLTSLISQFWFELIFNFRDITLFPSPEYHAPKRAIIFCDKTWITSDGSSIHNQRNHHHRKLNRFQCSQSATPSVIRWWSISCCLLGLYLITEKCLHKCLIYVCLQTISSKREILPHRNCRTIQAGHRSFVARSQCRFLLWLPPPPVRWCISVSTRGKTNLFTWHPRLWLDGRAVQCLMMFLDVN